MKLGKRHVRRGHLAKVHEATRSRVARMLAAPPERAVWRPLSGVAEALRRAGEPVVLSDLSRKCPWSEGESANVPECPIDGRAVLVPSDRFDFGGSFGDVARLRERLDASSPDGRPFIVVLDYFVNPIQIQRARDHGADAVLLIARLVGRDELSALIHAARSRGLEPIVECATTEEASLAEDLEVRIAAVSLRDRDNLRAFDLDAELAKAIERFDRKVALSVDAATALSGSAFDAVFVRASC